MEPLLKVRTRHPNTVWVSFHCNVTLAISYPSSLVCSQRLNIMFKQRCLLLLCYIYFRICAYVWCQCV